MGDWRRRLSTWWRWGRRRGDRSPAMRSLERRIGYRFRDPGLLRLALTHRSHLVTSGASRLESNERLEFLGDSVIGLVVNHHLYRSHPDLAEGDLTVRKARLVSGASLATVAAELGLGSYLLLSHGEESTGGRERESILADAFEALVGALYLDGGLDTARRFLANTLLTRIDHLMEMPSLDNPKSRLQEIIQARFKEPPRYRVGEVSGPDHDRRYDVEVTCRGRVLGTGSGHSKKSAEQDAAAAALARLEAEPELLEGLEP